MWTVRFVEVRDSRTGYLVPVRDGQGTLPDVESCRAAAAPRRPVHPSVCNSYRTNMVMDFLPEIYGLTVHVYALLSRNISSDGPYRNIWSDLPEIYGPYGLYMTFLPEDMDRTVHI